MSMAALQRHGAWRGVIAALALLGTVNSAFASPGCDAVNAGAWNGFMNSSTVGVSNFAVGDKIQIQATAGGASQILELVGYANFGNTVVAQAPLPGTINYTVTGTNDDTDLYLAISIGTTFTATITATCNLQSSGSSSSDARAAVRGFLLSRINGILLNDPTNVSVLNRSLATSTPMTTAMANGAMNVASRGGAFGASTTGVGAGLGNAMGLGGPGPGDADVGAAGGQTIQFSQSLSQLRRQAAQAQMQKDRMTLGAGDGGALPLSYAPTSPWDIWAEGRYSGFTDDKGNLDRSGHVGVLHVGGDYRLAQNMIVGVLAQFDWAKDDSSVLASQVSGNGWMVGPYLSARVHDNIYLDLRAAWGRSSNDMTLGAATGNFDTSRWLVKGKLAANWTYGAWRITPSADLAYITESANAFTNSAGTFVAGQDVSLGRLQFGPEIGYRLAHTADTFIEPFAAIKGVWNFHNPNVAIVNGIVVGPGDFWGRLQGGLNIATASGWSVRGLASWDGIGTSGYNGYTLQGTVNVPLN
jgi:outer membrane autotransporter protein